MIVVTGACGFIASVLIGELNKKGIDDIMLVDDFDIDDRLGFSYYERYTYLQNKKLYITWEQYLILWKETQIR